jgi:hypothetical protein
VDVTDRAACSLEAVQTQAMMQGKVRALCGNYQEQVEVYIAVY